VGPLQHFCAWSVSLSAEVGRGRGAASRVCCGAVGRAELVRRACRAGRGRSLRRVWHRARACARWLRRSAAQRRGFDIGIRARGTVIDARTRRSALWFPRARDSGVRIVAEIEPGGPIDQRALVARLVQPRMDARQVLLARRQALTRDGRVHPRCPRSALDRRLRSLLLLARFGRGAGVCWSGDRAAVTPLRVGLARLSSREAGGQFVGRVRANARRSPRPTAGATSTHGSRRRSRRCARATCDRRGRKRPGNWARPPCTRWNARATPPPCGP
jgi:hypothetical protein